MPEALLELADAEPALRNGVQAIGSGLDDLLLQGEKWQAQVGGAFTDGTIKRKTDGASELVLNVRDPERTLLNSPLLQADFDVELDDLGFSYVACDMSSILSPLSLTFEDREVHRLRQLHGPVKAFRDKVTRVEFVHQLVKKAAKGWGPIGFFGYQPHKVQPIANAAQSRTARTDARNNHGPGLDSGVKLTVKGVAASAAQVQLGDLALRVAASHNAPQRVQVALIAALIDESVMGEASGNVLQAIGSGGASIGSPTEEVVGFLTGKNWTIQGGAIGYFKAHSGASPSEIAGAVQLNAIGAAAYAPFVDEARRWVEAFQGGSAGGGTTTVTTVERFAFEVRKKESYWDAIQRLAKQVGWRAFMKAGRLFFVPDTYLIKAMPRVRLSPGDPGVDDVNFNFDTGKAINEVHVLARANQWGAPPGTVGILSDCGPANGRYLVAEIDAPLRRVDPVAVDITLRRPTKPLPEPAPKTSTKQIGGGSSGAGGPSGAPKGVQDAIAKMIDEIDRIDAKHYPYSTPGARGTPPPASGPYDCSGFVSRILYVGGLIKTTEATPQLSVMYEAGLGKYLSLYVRGSAGSAGHVVGRIMTPSGWRFFATSTSNPGGGAGWVPDSEYSASYLATLPSRRHPKGF